MSSSSSSATSSFSTSYYSTSYYPSSSSSSSYYFANTRQQRKKMSLTQTYYLAHTARKKLTTQAARADHDLRLLVGHANLLDSLMLELADAEQEQERWFNQTVNGATRASQEEPSQSRHIQWAETVVEDPEDDWDPEDVSDADSDVSDDSEYDEDDFVINAPPSPPPASIRRSRAPSPVAIITEHEIVDEDEEDSDSDFEDDDLEDLEQLTLTRSPSRQCPPDLASDSDEDEEEDDSLPPTPPQPTFDSFNAANNTKQPDEKTTELGLPDSDHPGLFAQGYYVSRQDQGTIIEAF